MRFFVGKLEREKVVWGGKGFEFVCGFFEDEVFEESVGG